MGEKRAYKARKPGGGRKKLKPEYNAGENLKEQQRRYRAMKQIQHTELLTGSYDYPEEA